MSVLAIIPARGGSKGIVNKNMLTLGGKTLVQLAVECARESGLCDRIVVNSDSDAILDSAMEIGCEVIERPPRLALDATPTEHVILHTLWDAPRDYDAVFVLQPTTPQRTPECLREAWKLFREPWKPPTLDFAEGYPDCIFSVAPQREPVEKLLRYEGEGYVSFVGDPNRTQRQRYNTTVARNGTYLLSGERALSGRWYEGKCRAFAAPGLSIDTEEDWEEVRRKWECQEAVRLGSGLIPAPLSKAS